MANERASFITPDGLLDHWQGHRRLTRRVIDAFGLEYAWAPLDDITLEAFVGVPSFREGVPVRPTPEP